MNKDKMLGYVQGMIDRYERLKGQPLSASIITKELNSFKTFIEESTEDQVKIQTLKIDGEEIAKGLGNVYADLITCGCIRKE